MHFVSDRIRHIFTVSFHVIEINCSKCFGVLLNQLDLMVSNRIELFTVINFWTSLQYKCFFMFILIFSWCCKTLAVYLNTEVQMNIDGPYKLIFHCCQDLPFLHDNLRI